ncbi:double-stranded RNA-binding protein 1-like isoform X2 [Lotus japonicus]|uniref:double-stranded RNA-binding protein 1-like isoform X2 n=1 Tax=Lotus japonicus TaxID=34305 RepID=UPI00258C0513|nr:double-stranded RNA-binding protein 1-like isoform X2 [Lotus japonicus]
MYKTKLQVLCQKNSWSLPDYETSREGPDHNPRFSSTVTVNGVPFSSASPSCSAKLAQNDAAMLAFIHFSQPNPTPIPLPIPNPKPNPVPSLPNLHSFPQPSFGANSTSSSASSGSSTDVVNMLPTDRRLQLKLEEACQTSQTSGPVTAVKDVMITQDQKNMLHLCKNQLQSYAQKRNIGLPVYSSEWEGPPHAMKFKCKVTIDGQSYESPSFYSTLKDAEHAAAKVALMSLSPGGVQEDVTGLYKNLLQELVQKEGFRLPVYSTNKSGQAHIPIFVSQVEIGGELFTGDHAKSKKLAETSAAKFAYTALKERKGKSNRSTLSLQPAHQGEDPKFLSDTSESNDITGLQHNANPKPPVNLGFATRGQPDKDKSKSNRSSLFPLSAQQGQDPESSTDTSESNVITNVQHTVNPKSLVNPGLVTQSQPGKDKNIVTVKKGSSTSGNSNHCSGDSSLSNGKFVPPLSGITNEASATSDASSTAVSSSSPRKKLGVYSRKTNVKIEDGGTILPISDDKWVAYSYSH